MRIDIRSWPHMDGWWMKPGKKGQSGQAAYLAYVKDARRMQRITNGITVGQWSRRPLEVLAPPCEASKKHVQPTRLLGWEQVVTPRPLLGHLWIAPADWAHDYTFLQACGCTLVWEALGPWCQSHGKAMARQSKEFE